MERAELADALIAAGPDAPTLCTGWTARDLAAHLVVRENRPDAAAGIVLAPVRGWTERVQRAYAAGDFERLVARFRDGPPRLSIFGIPGVDARTNLVEFLVHCEDVRRGRPGWRPRDLSAERQAAIWNLLSGPAGRMFLRASPVGVELVEPGGGRVRPAHGDVQVTISGAPLELLLYTTGRRDHAEVTVEGEPAAVDRLAAARLGL